MEKVYRYGCICKYCEKIFDIFDIDFLYVIFVLNYFMEFVLIYVKNVMFLMILWCVCIFSKEFI